MYRPLLDFGVALVDFGDGACDAVGVVEEGTVEVEADGGGFRWWSYVDHVDGLGRLLMVRLFFSNVLFSVVQVGPGFVIFLYGLSKRLGGIALIKRRRMLK